MMKNILKIFVGFSFAWLASACQQNELDLVKVNPSVSTEVGVFGDQMKLCLGVDAPDPVEIVTRGVDPDGKALQTLTVFCFDRNGLLISTSTAKVNPKAGVEDNTEGTIDVSIPIATRIMHLVGNQNMAQFDRNTFTNKSEDEVLSILEGSAGMLIYWARIEVPANVGSLYAEAKYELADGSIVTASEFKRTEPEAIVDWLTIETNPAGKAHRGIDGKGNPIILLRNQARFSIVSDGYTDDDQWKGEYFEVTGFAVCNTPAFGTVAPYHTDYGFPTYAYTGFVPYYGIEKGQKGVWLNDSESVTLPARTDKLTDVNDVSNARDQFIFETENLSTDPVDLILRGYNIVNGERETVERYYYRVHIMNDDGEMITIRRNHHYQIHIEENLTNGCLTFEEALRSPATNNIWLSISDEVKAIRDNKIELSVGKTRDVVDANDLEDYFNRMRTYEFNVNKLADDVVLDADKLTVQWIESDQLVSSTFNPDLVVGGAVAFDTATGEGAVNIQLNELPEGEEMVRGTLLIKYGRLQRKIAVVIVRQQEFIPAWVSSEVYGKLTGDDYKGEHVTVIFNIPETCPEELFPMKVLVTTNGLDGRAASGQVLPIVKKGDDTYGDEFEIVVNEGTDDERTLTDLGYKYEYTATAPGQHRLYFHNIFEVEQGAIEYVVLQAAHFETIAKPVTYVDHKNKILMPGLKNYTADPNASESDVIQYMLVPQKRFAPVTFDIALKVSDGTGYGTLDKEEFLLYSTNIDHYPDDDSRLNDYTTVTPSDFDCYFKPYAESMWGTGGRIYGFYPRAQKNANEGIFENKVFDGVSYDVFQIYLETNKPKSAEVVRIASNQVGSPSVKDDSKSYDGLTFRSTTFELANYRPFRFAAQVNGEGSYVADDATSGTQEPEVVDEVQFTYLPDDIVEVSFDVTSFKADDESSVDPFGTGFEIFIDAPMLTLKKGDNKNIDGKDFEDIRVWMFDKAADGTHITDQSLPKLEDLGDGRFVYRVDQYGDEEALHWNHLTEQNDINAALIKDETRQHQMGERKTIRFRKNSIVSQGDIVVSSNPDHVTFHSKTFAVSNESIVGRIGYVPEDEAGNPLSGEPIPVPADQFVSFSRVLDDSRIGSLIVKPVNELNPTGPTTYELRLRGEYEFRWTNDPIKIQTQIDGKYYSIVIPDLQTLYGSPKIILEQEKQQAN